MSKSERLSSVFYGTSSINSFRNDILPSDIKNTKFISQDYERFLATHIIIIDKERAKEIKNRHNCSIESNFRSYF